jgi:N-acetylglucosaminyl-diphospho-decaprenol L-rhamnosyltransferase
VVKDGSVIIVTYNCAGFIKPCLESLAPDRERWEVIVVDNGSRDGTLDVVSREFPWARLEAQGQNRGLAAACNIGASLATLPNLLFLNPDTVVMAGALDALKEELDASGVAMVAPRLHGLDGLFQQDSAERRVPTFLYLAMECLGVHHLVPRWFRRRVTLLPGFEATQPCDIEQPIGAALLVRRDAFDALGGFDEQFHPIWFDDTDFCKRLTESGRRIRYVPNAVITHARQHSLPLFTTTQVRAIWNANAVRYARKHFRGGRAELIRLFATLGTVVRATIYLARRRGRPAGLGHFKLGWRMVRFAEASSWYSLEP